MLLNLNKALSKSALRHIFVGVGFVVVAMQTYLAKGNHLGYNTETFVGIGAQILITLLPVVQRYVDKTDPALGAPTKAALVLADAKLEPLTEPKPVASTLLPNTILPVPVMAPADPSVEVPPITNP